jgi:hypothetical protein
MKSWWCGEIGANRVCPNFRRPICTINGFGAVRRRATQLGSIPFCSYDDEHHENHFSCKHTFTNVAWFLCSTLNLIGYGFKESDHHSACQSGLPGGLFPDQKSQFGKLLEGLRWEYVDIFYGLLEYFIGIWDILWPFGTFCVPLVHFFRFWHHVPRTIWQPSCQLSWRLFESCCLASREYLNCSLNPSWINQVEEGQTLVLGVLLS